MWSAHLENTRHHVAACIGARNLAALIERKFRIFTAKIAPWMELSEGGFDEC